MSVLRREVETGWIIGEAHGVRVTLNDEIGVVEGGRPDLLALHRALRSLGRIDERKSRIIELRTSA